MRVVFLDVDGVLNSLHDYWAFLEGKGDPHPLCYAIDRGKLAIFKRIVAETGAEIVVSSSWREDDMDYSILTQVLETVDLRPIDRTPQLPKQPRGNEIFMWLTGHPEVKQFVILDDCNDMEPIFEHLVQTKGAYGIDEDDAEQAIAILKCREMF